LINPVSLYQITGTQYNVPDLAHELLAQLMKSAERLQAGETAAILERYNQRLYKRNETVTLRNGDSVISTTIRGVTEDGRLVTSDTEERTFDFGEVAWLG
ncbi:MAG TPA: biotin--[acetyl-CoA-carboxylase] ligase, partial [Ferruginibacter sp.]|nr:biotin--[acetyl-CoA-carboxylase] ligase [Ferruginibacter sp.]